MFALGKVMITVFFLLNFFSGEKSPSGSPREQCPQGNLRTVRGIVVVSCMFARYYWSSAHSHIDFELAIIVTKPLFVLGKDWLSLFKTFKVVLLNGGDLVSISMIILDLSDVVAIKIHMRGLYHSSRSCHINMYLCLKF